MTAFTLAEWKARIDAMDAVACARLLRFAPAGHHVFTTPALHAHFTAHFERLGGMTPALSKWIGWAG